MSDENWGPEKELPSLYRVFENSSGIDFYVPTQDAPADVPKSFEVFAGSIDKQQLYDGEGVYLRLSGVDVMTGDLEMGNQNIVNVNDVTASGQATMGGATVTGEVTTDNEKAVRNIIQSQEEPTPTDGNNGDIWIQYEV